MKIGVVDVGGGNRGIYAAGVLDYCLAENIRFDLGIGVSAGSANLISYAAGQQKRNYQFYAEYSSRKEYSSFKNFLTKKSFIDLDYIYGTLTNSDGENPLDYASFIKNPMEFYVVASETRTGKVHFFNKKDFSQDHYDVLKASCAIPFVCHPYSVNNIEYFDGGISNPVPIKEAFKFGCDKVVLLLTKPIDFVRGSRINAFIAKIIRHSYPKAAENLTKMAKSYNDSIKWAKEKANMNDLLIVAPEDTYGVDTLTKNHNKLTKLYKEGYRDGKKIKNFISEFSI